MGKVNKQNIENNSRFEEFSDKLYKWRQEIDNQIKEMGGKGIVPLEKLRISLDQEKREVDERMSRLRDS